MLHHQTISIMTIIANPIYDAVFKFLMEDKKVAKILLSALLKKEIIDLEMRRHEYTSMEQTRISLFRIDFSAKIRESDGSEHLVLIELQKTWLITETLRFRKTYVRPAHHLHLHPGASPGRPHRAGGLCAPQLSGL